MCLGKSNSNKGGKDSSGKRKKKKEDFGRIAVHRMSFEGGNEVQGKDCRGGGCLA